MKPTGAPGCVLYTGTRLEVGLPTSGGSASRSEGKLILPTSVPNDPNLRGAVVSVQIIARDTKPKRPLPLIVTNAIELTIL